MEKYLVIVPFKTKSGQNYIYDDITGTIFPVYKETIDILKNYEKLSFEKTLEMMDPNSVRFEISKNFVNHWITKYNAFYRFHAEENKLNVKDNIKAIVNNSSQSVLLEITENCNFQCEYCAYSEHYKNTREETENKMEISIGKKAIDYYLKINKESFQSNPEKKFIVGFYGGEPLLNFECLKELVEYANGIEIGADKQYIITTNGYLLDEERAKFLVQNNFKILISLDGPKVEHDKNRKLKNGKGTFDKIYGNLTKFKELFPNYNDINFITVIDWTSNLEMIKEFFMSIEATIGKLSFITNVSDIETNYYSKFNIRQKHIFNQRLKHLKDEYLKKEREGHEISTFEKLFFYMERYKDFRNRQDDQKNAIFEYSATCIPGKKLMVRTNGDFDICEKVNGKNMIGNVHTGFNYDAILKIMEVFNDKVLVKCKSCPITKICSHCYATCNSGSTFERPDCEKLRKEVKSALKVVTETMEINHNAFSK